MRCSRNLLALSLLALLCLPGAVRAADLAKPTGPVVLTVAGKIENTNRPAFDPASDVFLKYLEKTFTKAAAFDHAMLEQLGLHEVEVTLEGWPARVRFEGPRLKDLLTAVGAAGETITVVALDNYASEIPWTDLDLYDWIVAVKKDGVYLGLGQQGPLWVVYGYPDGRVLTADDEARWPWSAIYIEIN